MTTVRIAHSEPRPGKLANGEFQTRGHLVVLADDAGHRAVPIWLRGEPGSDDLSQLVELASRLQEEITVADVPEELIARLLRAAGATVTGVDIDVTAADISELSPEATVARISLAGSAGARQVTAGLGLGLAMAAAAAAPVRVPDAVMDRLAVRVEGDDLLTPFLDRVPPVARAAPGHGLRGWPMATLPRKRPRFEPRNLDFADGLDRWDLDCSVRGEAGEPPAEDYVATAEDRTAVLRSAVPRPAGSASLLQTIFAEDYRGRTVVFRAKIRTAPMTGQAGLRLEIFRQWWRTGRYPREDHGVTVGSVRRPWTMNEVSALIPHDADLIRFGIGLAGPGEIDLRDPELRTAEPAVPPAGGDAGTPRTESANGG
jgi:hypothetical protein